ncbi:hypothetical protein ACFL59_01725 [Planctomycetota bacterium]
MVSNRKQRSQKGKTRKPCSVGPDEDLRIGVEIVDSDDGTVVDFAELRRLLIRLAIDSWRRHRNRPERTQLDSRTVPESGSAGQGADFVLPAAGHKRAGAPADPTRPDGGAELENAADNGVQA